VLSLLFGRVAGLLQELMLHETSPKNERACDSGEQSIQAAK
jgi:hypothetical protein